ncbi:ABC transporter permease [Gordonia sp. WA4-43]|uniref:ABC transporter permease n=1 Tax=Gordonia sp. WA4-43 TaxID=2878678 RepID=UPI001CFAC300|nr:ABC transporter permease [Gordonia sp. WA4-43]UCZ91777.1 ABC transporter permease [Gordonia sp. WA4-43]
MTAAVSSGGIALPQAIVRISALQQWWVLTNRGLTKVVRNGEVLFALVSPLMLAACFYLPLRSLVAELGYNYAQFLMPIIMLQSMSFVASAAAMRSAMDGLEGVHARFRVLPMAELVPVLARTTTNVALLLVAVICGLSVCWMIGWRPLSAEDGGTGWSGTLVAVSVVIAFGLLLALCADGIGLVAKTPEATSQLIAFPTLILGMLSTGFMPLTAFPDWIQGFVKNQPISQIVSVMNRAQSGTLTWQTFAPTLYWCLGLLAVAVLLFGIYQRRTAR